MDQNNCSLKIDLIGKDQIDNAWSKAKPIKGLDPSMMRADDEHYVIRYDHYGRTDSEFGWQVVQVNAPSDARSQSEKSYRARHCKAVSKG